MLRPFSICLLIALAVPAYGETGLKPVHPDESADYTFNERLSVNNSLESLAAVKSALASFRKLTAAATGKIPRERLAEIGNTGWEIQNLGFVNYVETIKGTLLKQDYLIKKLRYELAQQKSKSGEITGKDLLEAKGEFEKAEKQFQGFWNTFGVAD
jgi:hypothetical protein